MIRLILSGIFALLPLLVQLCLLPITILCSIPACCFLLTTRTGYSTSTSSNQQQGTNTSTTTKEKVNEQQEQQNGRQIIIIGGSTGIGYSIAMAAAKESIKQSFNSNNNNNNNNNLPIKRIVIVAQNKERLVIAKTNIENEINKLIIEKNKKDNNKKDNKDKDTTSTVMIETYSVDVTDPIAIETTAKEIMTSTSSSNSNNIIKTHLFLCVGASYPKVHDDYTNDDYYQQVLINQLSTIYTCNAFLPYIKQSSDSIDGGGTITFTCSMGGLIGVYGFSAYSPTKFALRGYVETMYMELLHYNPKIQIQIVYPPDTDTPGYVRENIHKPYITQLISQVAGLANPDDIGTTMLYEVLYKQIIKYQIYFNFDGFLLCNLCCNFTPVTSFIDIIFQVTLLNFIRIIALLYLSDWYRIIIKEHNKKNTNTTTNNSNTSKNKNYNTITTDTTTTTNDTKTTVTTTDTKNKAINNDTSKID